ncbi:hypothetical protein F5Y16DRAFT_361565, partial [Xylariaceae sp. FL0255]
MYGSFHWTVPDQASSGTAQFGRRMKETRSIVPKTPTTAYLTPKMYPGDGDPTFPRSQRDGSLLAGLVSPFNTKHLKRAGTINSPPLDVNRWSKQRAMSNTVFAGLEKRGGGPERSDFLYDVSRRVRIFEERVGGLDQQLNIIQKMINETLLKNNMLEEEYKTIQGRASEVKTKYLEPEVHGSTNGKEKRKASLDSEISKHDRSLQRLENEPKIAELQDQLNGVQVKIQTLASDYERQKAHFEDKYRDTQNSLISRSEDREAVNALLMERHNQMVSHTNDVVERLDRMTKEAGGSIVQYLSQFHEAQMFKHDTMEDLHLSLKSSLDRWNQQTEEKVKINETFEKKLEQMYEDRVRQDQELTKLKDTFDNARQKEVVRLEESLLGAEDDLRKLRELNENLNALKASSAEQHYAEILRYKDELAEVMKISSEREAAI